MLQAREESLEKSRVFVVLRDRAQADRTQWRGRGIWRQGNQLVGASKEMIAAKLLPDTVFEVSKQRGQVLAGSADIVREKSFGSHRQNIKAIEERAHTISSLFHRLDNLQLGLLGSCQLSLQYLRSFSRRPHLAMEPGLCSSQFRTIAARNSPYLLLQSILNNGCQLHQLQLVLYPQQPVEASVQVHCIKSVHSLL